MDFVQFINLHKIIWVVVQALECVEDRAGSSPALAVPCPVLPDHHHAGES